MVASRTSAHPAPNMTEDPSAMRKYQNNPKVINFYKVCRWGREGFAGSTRDVALRAQHGMSVAAVCLHPPSVCEGGVEPTTCQGDGERTRACVCARARVRFYLCARAHLPSLVYTSRADTSSPPLQEHERHGGWAAGEEGRSAALKRAGRQPTSSRGRVPSAPAPAPAHRHCQTSLWSPQILRHRESARRAARGCARPTGLPAQM